MSIFVYQTLSPIETWKIILLTIIACCMTWPVIFMFSRQCGANLKICKEDGWANALSKLAVSDTINDLNAISFQALVMQKKQSLGRRRDYYLTRKLAQKIGFVYDTPVWTAKGRMGVDNSQTRKRWSCSLQVSHKWFHLTASPVTDDEQTNSLEGLVTLLMYYFS